MGDEQCEECGQYIRDVAAYQRISVLKPRFEVTSEREIPARSAIEALFLLDEAVEAEALASKVEAAIERQLKTGAIHASELTYEVADPKIKLPRHLVR